MPKNGYWIECVPALVSESKFTDLSATCSIEAKDKATNSNLSADLYTATVSSIPDVSETAPSPDLAIQKIRDRLRTIREDYKKTGRLLPDLDNPVKPPNKFRNRQGWISIYIEISDTSIH
jgi:hypothetical protein